MNMSHQVIITFDLDESQVAENAAKEAGRQIANQILKESFQDNYLGSYSAKRSAQTFIKNEIVEFLTENKEEIMDVAIKEVVLSLTRSKAVREKMQEALNGKEGTDTRSRILSSVWTEVEKCPGKRTWVWGDML